MNLIAYSYGLDKLKKDDEIVLSIMEHHSNLVPWQKVAKTTGAKLNYMYINDEFELSDEEIESKITDKTKIDNPNLKIVEILSFFVPKTLYGIAKNPAKTIK